MPPSRIGESATIDNGRKAKDSARRGTLEVHSKVAKKTRKNYILITKSWKD